MQRGGFFC
ncbi:hypothetical protein ECEC1869_3174, partial [Escherichia coli EC1869]